MHYRCPRPDRASERAASTADLFSLHSDQRLFPKAKWPPSIGPAGRDIGQHQAVRMTAGNDFPQCATMSISKNAGRRIVPIAECPDGILFLRNGVFMCDRRRLSLPASLTGFKRRSHRRGVSSDSRRRRMSESNARCRCRSIDIHEGSRNDRLEPLAAILIPAAVPTRSSVPARLLRYRSAPFPAAQ